MRGRELFINFHLLYPLVSRSRGLVDVEFILDTLNSKPDKAIEEYLKMVGAEVEKLEYKSDSEIWDTGAGLNCCIY